MKGILFFALFLLPLEFLSAAIAGSVACPPEYGKILYECNPTNQKQLFIIGMGHRDALTRSNGSQTAKIQAEVYKIGEWLVRQEGVELLLPEGFFKNPRAKTVPSPLPPQPEREGFGKPLDRKTLEAKLSDQRTFLNAEILLKRNYPIVLQQVEDKNCYEEVGEWLRRISACRYSAEEYGRTKAELEYLQEKRTALMLQKIPAIINNEYGAENIKTRKAILTIGLAHIPMIRKYLIDRKIRIDSPPPSMRAHEAHFAGLTLLEQNFRISIFLPKSLADTPNILKMNTLGKNVSGLSASSGITNQRTTIFSH